ncbi:MULTISPECIES: hypothetical protein [Dehalococcoides]|jgi:hypothetical protein|uniref:Uncharacterized protein n=1 Tax=Dehalococcoides mccartyi TaxID=61435 RepID=A0A142VD01_9CHLR|nr:MULTISPECIES: hypothetical protein [Dehalococcoides]AGG06985.1 hypothetical protein dcmb_1396 [Dehalococcoides mccartyi DCMB5]AMU87187.1 hypothetical protein Dm11a5_1361 [Dehalococcoides mccartyi]RAL68928.1 hypothetical protein C1G87_1402 [Dehalococcoides mccartyi]RAL70113.1 hypothetical protein C1G86_1438 [Dehalococcoides mccartyi]BAS32423.1 hypothetical protein IBK_1391 [Dehalococcoides mccartyi IBARAKI]
MVNESIKCPVCSQGLGVKLATGRKSGKPLIMFVCSRDGRHFRGFISHQEYVKQVLQKLENSIVSAKAMD